jgi:hypothetical protein
MKNQAEKEAGYGSRKAHLLELVEAFRFLFISFIGVKIFGRLQCDRFDPEEAADFSVDSGGFAKKLLGFEDQDLISGEGAQPGFEPDGGSGARQSGALNF